MIQLTQWRRQDGKHVRRVFRQPTVVAEVWRDFTDEEDHSDDCGDEFLNDERVQTWRFKVTIPVLDDEITGVRLSMSTAKRAADQYLLVHGTAKLHV